MTELTITGPVAYDLLKAVVDERGGGYVYDTEEHDGCRYADDDGQPACLIGHVLSHLGVLDAIEARHQAETIGAAPVKDVVYSAAAGRGIRITDFAFDVWAAAQDVQDKGEPWGDALRAAHSELTL